MNNDQKETWLLISYYAMIEFFIVLRYMSYNEYNTHDKTITNAVITE